MYKVIFDADGIVYRVGFALEDVNSERIVQKRVQEYIDYHMAYITKTFVKVTKVPTVVISAPGKSNFRYDLAKTLPYKGNRAAPKPKHYDLIRQILSKMESFYQIDGQEADDTIADLAAKDPEHTIIVSQDKDLLQNPGWYYIPGGRYVDYVDDEDGNPILVELEAPKRPIFYVNGKNNGYLQLEMHTGGKKVIFGVGKTWLGAQMLLGDASDNIPGLKGYGSVRINKLYSEYPYMDFTNVVLDQYVSSFKDLKVAHERYNEIYTLLKIGGHQK